MTERKKEEEEERKGDSGELLSPNGKECKLHFCLKLREERDSMRDKMGTVACRINTVRTAFFFLLLLLLLLLFIHSRNIGLVLFFICCSRSFLSLWAIFVLVFKSSVVLSDTFGV